MKNLTFLLFPLLLMCFTNVSAQNLLPEQRCGTMNHAKQFKQNHPGNYPGDPQFESWMAKQIAKQKTQNKGSVVFTIPIVFHVIHSGGGIGQGDNISAFYINAQLQQLNNDFRKIAGTSGDNNHPAGADTEIQFCLAAVDENGTPLAEPGINRINASAAGLPSLPYGFNQLENTVKAATGWDPAQYFNVWVCNLGGGLLGYAQFPDNSGLGGLGPNGGNADTDGVVVLYTAVGSSTNPFPGGAPYDKGRTLTHEIGHWLGLLHIWGDSNCGNDFCADTPEASGSHFGCPSSTTCDGIPDMVENYMDYSDDACMNIFTNDQKARMQTVMTVSPRRMELATSTVCNTMPAPPISGFIADVTFSCVAPLTVQFTDQSGGFPAVSSWSWSFPGGVPATSTAQNPQVTYNANGMYDVTLVVTNSAGSDTEIKTTYITVDNSLVGIANPVVEGFQTVGFPPAGWTVINPDNDITWARTTSAGFNSTASMYMNYWNYQTNESDDLNLPGVDISNIVNTSLTFDLAYALYSDIGGGFSDTLEILVSDDCGTTFTSVYKKFEATLVTAPNHTSEFFPTANEWRNEFVDLSAFDGNSNLEVVFRGTSDYENNLFVDNINISGMPAGTPPVAAFTTTISNTGCETATVQFTDNSTNMPTSWSWTFAGGTPATSTMQNPVVTFNGSGTFGATLISSNVAGNDTQTQASIVTIDPAVTATTIGSSILCNGDMTGTASVTATGTGPFTYLWSTSQAVPSLNGLGAGTYNVSVTDANSCVAVESAIVSEPAALSSTGSSTPESCGLNNGSASVASVGGTAPYQVSWDNGQSGAMIAGLPGGTYVATILDANSCSTTVSVAVAGGPATTATISSVAASCSGNDGSATATIISGTAPYTYMWNDGQMTATAMNLAAGSYSVVITDANGCSFSSSVNITSASGLSATSSSTTENCGASDGTATVNPTGGMMPYTYLWNDGQTAQTALNLAGGNYTVAITDAMGCLFNETVTVPSISNVTAMIAGVDAACGMNNGTATATPAGGTAPYQYLWNNGQANMTATNLAPGAYTVLITDGNSCTTTAIVNINDTPMVQVAATGANETCNGAGDGSATATATAGISPFTYSWSNGQSGAAQGGLTPGIYIVTATDAVGCTSVSSITIAAGPAISLGINTTDVSCGIDNDGTAIASIAGGTPPVVYEWSNNTVAPGIAGLIAGTYFVTATDANGCSTTGSATILDPNIDADVVASMLVIDLYVDPTVQFTDNSVGATSWDWDFGDSGTSMLQNPTHTYTQEGTYTVTVIVSNGQCSDTQLVTITVIDTTPPSAIEDVAGLSDLTIYPNPTTGRFSIEMTLSQNTDLSINVINALGQTLITDELGAVSGAVLKSYDLATFANGIYFVQITDGRNSVTEKLFYNW